MRTIKKTIKNNYIYVSIKTIRTNEKVNVVLGGIVVCVALEL